ncbi:antibiotic biosynthesis monooxygenase family protein [Marinobacter mobilis]|uniref:antibiotic biosynthesis monooxygenase family protein n=1 Tax=Marinobacter mobilis TaxID=488533 RepID=UPI001FDEC392|nr:antibiotic biosynthesis monooxygenase [Marinobacter mobilis]
MIRVVYRWKVQEARFAEFQTVWSRTTNTIHETVPGALGSFMLRSPDDKTEVMTVAKWESMAHWTAFWGAENRRGDGRHASAGRTHICHRIR